MRDKPRVFKDNDRWSVELPAFGFGRSQVKGGFPSREAAGEWLKKRQEHSPLGGSFERTSTPRSRWADMNWPVVAR